MLIDILLIDTGFHYHWIESNVIVLKIESSNRNCCNKYPRCLKKSIWHFHLVLYLHMNMVESKEQRVCPCIASVKYFPSSSTFSYSDIFVRRLCREIIYLCSNHLVFALKDTCYWEVGFRPCQKVDISMEYLEWSSEDPIMNSDQTDGAVSPASTFLCMSRKICVLV